MKRRSTTGAILTALIASTILLAFTNREILASGDNRLPAAGNAQGNLPSARQLLDKHLRLTGGTTLNSYIIKGSITGFDQGSVRVEFYKDGDKELAKVFFPSGEQEVEFYDGTSGWRKEPDGSVIDLGNDTSEEPESLGHYVKFIFLLNQKGNIYGDYEALKTTGLTKVSARDAYVLEGKIKGGGLDKYYLDKQAGVLLRSESFDESNKPTDEVVWSNYRVVAGKQVPHKVQVKEGERAFSIDVSEIKINTKIDPAIFKKPED